MTHALVIGGGISGLAAAWEFAQSQPPCTVTVIEERNIVGGKIATERFAGIDVDRGPDSFLARVPAAAALAREVGLGDDLVAPATGQAWMWARGQLRALPTGLVLGVPTDIRGLVRSGVLPRQAAARAALDLVLPGAPVAADTDISVGELVRRRMGRGVQLGLVDPLLGGINAGHTDHLSAAVAAPQLLAAGRAHRSLIRGLHASGTSGTASGAVTAGGLAGGGLAPGAVFLTVSGGLQRLPDTVAAKIAATPGCAVRTGVGATALTRTATGWTAQTSAGPIDAEVIVLACPPAVSAGLIERISPASALQLRSVAMSSVVLTVFAYPEGALARPLVGSGFLVPRSEDRLMTAASWLGSKWPHLATPGRVLIRASAGRIDDGRAMAMGDDALVEALHNEVVEAMHLTARPIEARVSRWPDAFPQFGVGHLDLMRFIDDRLAIDAPGLGLVGAARRGVGIATCISGGREVAARLIAR